MTIMMVEKTAKEKREEKKKEREERERTRCFVKDWGTDACKHCSKEKKCEADAKLLKEAENDDDSD